MSKEHATHNTQHRARPGPHAPLGKSTHLPRFDAYRLLLGLAILGYSVLFSQLAFDLHLGMRTHKADLGQIAQAIWNSSRGRFVESTDTGVIASRLTDHVEPILALISPALWLWDDVRALLLLQVVLVAVGAWPLYELTLTLLDKTLSVRERTHIWQLEPLRQLTRPIALALALAYLLAPQLQSAVLTEFHAAPLAVPLLLWAFWAIESDRLWHFVIATLLVAAVKEEMALLAAGLSLWAFWILNFRFWMTGEHPNQSKIKNLKSKFVPFLVLLGALTWFYIATFVIIPAHAVQIYERAESVYFGRYGALGDSPVDIFKSFFTQPAVVWQIVTEPARLSYLWGLLAPFGLLSLVAPEIILLALPLLLANLLSAYPAQYYGEFHYSAPLVPYIAASAAYGVGRLWRWLSHRTSRSSASYQHMAAASISMMTLVSLFTNARTALRPLIALGFTLWLLSWGGLTYLEAGRGPLAARYEPTPMTAHARLLSRFTAQLPAGAAVTATAAVHPHVSQRRYVYQFPIGVAELGAAGQAEWALLDVTTNTDMAPGDVKSAVDSMLAGAWGVVDGADGFLLLRRGATAKTIPAAFYDFARGAPPSPASAAPLTFTTINVEDWARWRQTRLQPCWQVGPAFPNKPTPPQLEVITPAGDLLYTFATAVPPALLWYPPERWQVGETVCIKTLPLSLPSRWGIRVAPGEASTATTAHPYTQALLRTPEGLTLVQLFQRTKEGKLTQIPAQPTTVAPIAASIEGSHPPAVQGTFLVAGQPLQATMWSSAQLVPNQVLTIQIEWQSDKVTEWPANLAAFIHIRQGEQTIAQADGPPRFFQLQRADERMAGDLWIMEWRQISLPATLTPGETVTVALGLYDPATGVRLPLQQASGGNEANELRLPALRVTAAPMPDQACALLPATCASQPTP